MGALLGVDCRTVIEDIEFDQEAVLQLLLRSDAHSRHLPHVRSRRRAARPGP